MISSTQKILKFLLISVLLIFCTNSCKGQRATVSQIEFKTVNYTENCKKTGSSLNYNLPIIQNSKNLETLIIQKLLDDDVFLFVNVENVKKNKNQSLSEIMNKELDLARFNCNSDDALSTSIECDYLINFNTVKVVSIQFSILTMQSNFNQFNLNINYDIDNQKELELLDLIKDEGVDFILKKSNIKIENLFKEFISENEIYKEDVTSDYKLNIESLKKHPFILVTENNEKGLKIDYDFPFDKRITNMLGKPDLFFSFNELKDFLIKDFE